MRICAMPADAPVRALGDRARVHGRRSRRCPRALLRRSACRLDWRRQLVDRIVSAHRRSLGDSRCRPRRDRAVGCKFLAPSAAVAAAPRRLFLRRRHLLGRHRGAAQDTHERGLPLGPHPVWGSLSGRAPLFRSPRHAASRTLLPCGARQLRICTYCPILCGARASPRACSRRSDHGRRLRRRVRARTTVPRCAFHFARCLERVSRVGDIDVRLQIRL